MTERVDAGRQLATTDVATPHRHRVVVIGGGFGGLNVTQGLDGADVEVTLVDRTNHHLFQPLLYQVAAGILPPGLIAPALRSIIKKEANARALLAEVMSIDLAKREVCTEAPDGRPLNLSYDTLIVAAGASHSYFGRDEFARFAPGMKTIEDARYLRDRVLSAFERAELSTDAQVRAELLTFVVIGAGPTGVETVGQIAELAHTVLPRDYRSIDTHAARIVLLEGAPAVLPPFHKKLQDYTRRQLEKMGVEIHTSSLATDMDDESVTFKGPDGEQTIRCRTRIWAAGVAASPLAKMLAEQTGAETDRAGRVAVNPDCTLPGHPEVFAIGDMVSLNKLPGVAQPAMQEGAYVAKVIKARLAGEPAPAPFKYFDKGSMATIGYRSAVADAFGVKVTGIVAYRMWAFIHVAYLVGWGNRLGILYTWSRALWFSHNRGHRIITFEQAHRQAANEPTPSEEEVAQDHPPAGAIPAQAGPVDDAPAASVPAGEREPG
jgi:NADH:ubiquinone reductase (H+-translocating)